MDVDPKEKYAYLFDLFKKDNSPKVIVSVVPWYSPEQFKKVYEYLYSADISKKRWAIDQITVWESRCYPSLPTAIEATYIITLAVIQDILYTNRASLCQEKDVKLMYAVALIRFVNLTIELHQTYRKQPIADVAECLGIPSWVVDLRNESSHSCLPSLPVLRMGAEEALIYLDKSYWHDLSQSVKPFVKEPVDVERIRLLLLAYQTLQFELRTCRKIEKRSKEYNSKLEIMKFIRAKCMFCMKKYKEEFIKTMCMEDIFITSIKDYEMVLEVKERGKVMKDFENTMTEKVVKIPELPLAVENFWYPLLRIVAKCEAIPDLIESLLHTQGDKPPETQILLASWVQRILRFPLTNFGPETQTTPLIKFFLKYTPLFNWHRVLYAAIANPCKYTPFFFSLITVHLKLSKEFLRQTMSLMAIITGQCSEEVQLTNHDPFTLEDLKKSKRLQEKKMKEGEEKETHTENKWSYAPADIDWKNIPIGHVFTLDEAKGGSSKDDCMDITDNTEYTYKYLSNTNESEVMEALETVERNNFEDDLRVISERKSFLYKRKY